MKRMKRICAILTICPLILTGCGGLGKIEAGITGYSKSCIDGVLYYQFVSGVTVAYNTDGTVRTCK